MGTLLADLVEEVSLAIEYATGLPEADPSRVGSVGHSYGGGMAMWAPAWDQRRGLAYEFLPSALG